MNLGAIPGYYWDADKRKYFKITANHASPAGAKHAKSNVKKEERDAKKRKIDLRRTDQRLKQTVHRSRISQDALLAGTGVARELGNHPATRSLEDRDASFLHHLHPTRTIPTGDLLAFPDFTLLDVQPLGASGLAGVALGRADYTGCVTAVIPFPDASKAHWPSDRESWCQAFSSSFLSLHMITEASDDLPPTVVAVTQEPSSPGNLFIGSLPAARAAYDREDSPRANMFTLGQAGTWLWDSALSRDKTRLAVSGTDDLYLADLVLGDVFCRLPQETESRAVAWLDATTIAFGSHDAKLWDVRSSGMATRFPRRRQPITGIQSPNHHGVQLLVSDNKRIELYDTRHGKAPLVSWQHVHQGPQLQWTVNEDLQIVSALDAENEVQDYSLRTGRRLGALRKPDGGHEALFTKLRWLDEGVGEAGSGMVLQACQGSGVVRWSWGGGDREEG